MSPEEQPKRVPSNISQSSSSSSVLDREPLVSLATDGPKLDPSSGLKKDDPVPFAPSYTTPVQGPETSLTPRTTEEVEDVKAPSLAPPGRAFLESPEVSFDATTNSNSSISNHGANSTDTTETTNNTVHHHESHITNNDNVDRTATARTLRAPDVATLSTSTRTANVNSLLRGRGLMEMSEVCYLMLN